MWQWTCCAPWPLLGWKRWATSDSLGTPPPRRMWRICPVCSLSCVTGWLVWTPGGLRWWMIPTPHRTNHHSPGIGCMFRMYSWEALLLRHSGLVPRKAPCHVRPAFASLCATCLTRRSGYTRNLRLMLESLALTPPSLSWKGKLIALTWLIVRCIQEVFSPLVMPAELRCGKRAFFCFGLGTGPLDSSRGGKNP